MLVEGKISYIFITTICGTFLVQRCLVSKVSLSPFNVPPKQYELQLCFPYKSRKSLNPLFITKGKVLQGYFNDRMQNLVLGHGFFFPI